MAPALGCREGARKRTRGSACRLQVTCSRPFYGHLAAYICDMGNEVRVGGWGKDRTRFAEHHRPPAPIALEPPLGTFLDGSPTDLTTEAVTRIYAINKRVSTRLPEITSNDQYAILYYEPTGYNFSRDSISLTVSSADGRIVDGGYGREWWQSMPEHPVIKELMDEFGMNAKPRPAATPIQGAAS